MGPPLKASSPVPAFLWALSQQFSPSCFTYALYGLLDQVGPKEAERAGDGSLSASQVVLVVKNPFATAGDIRDMGSMPGLGRSLGGGHGKPLQYSCLENSMDRGAWQAIFSSRVAKSRTRLNRLSMHAP